MKTSEKPKVLSCVFILASLTARGKGFTVNCDKSGMLSGSSLSLLLACVFPPNLGEHGYVSVAEGQVYSSK